MLWLPVAPSALLFPSLLVDETPASAISGLAFIPLAAGLHPTYDHLNEEGYGVHTDASDIPVQLIPRRTRLPLNARRVSAKPIIQVHVVKRVATQVAHRPAIVQVPLFVRHLPPHLSDPVLVPVLVYSYTQLDSVIPTSRMWLTGYALMHCGYILHVMCRKTLGRLFPRGPFLKDNHTLITNGPYAIVRHPSCTATWIISIGFMLCQFSSDGWYSEIAGWGALSRTLFVASFAVISLSIPWLLSRQMKIEEGVLKEEFGDQWEEYTRRTPYRLFPFMY